MNLAKAAGLAVGYPPLGKRVGRCHGVACLEWDKTNLRHIAEIARRVPTEGVAAVARDFRQREIEDRRGRPWGRPRPKPFSLFCTPYQSFYRAVRWIHRMKWKGLLPAPLRRPGGGWQAKQAIERLRCRDRMI